LDAVISGIMILVLGSVFLVVVYQGGIKSPVYGVIALFLYQIVMQAMVIYNIHTNIKTLYLLVLPLVVFFLFRKYRLQPYIKPFIPLLLFFVLNLIYMALNYAFDPNPSYGADTYIDKPKMLLPHTYSVDLVTYLGFLVSAVYMAVNTFSTSQGKQIFKQFVVYFLLLYSCFEVAVYFSCDHRFVDMLAGVKRLSAFNMHTNLLAFFNISMILYVLGLLYQNGREYGRLFRSIAFFAVVMGTVAVLLTFSRSINILFLGIIIINSFVLSPNKAKSLLRLALLAGVAVLAVGIMQGMGNINIADMLASRMGDESSTNFRPTTWTYLFSQFHWGWPLVFGQGIGAASSVLYALYSHRFFVQDQAIVYHPHNSFFHVFFDYGLLGFLLYYTPIFIILRKGFLNLQGGHNINALILVELLLLTLISSFTDAFLFNTETIPFWIIISALYMDMTTSGKRLALKASHI
jgi:O-antigen ligase